VWPGRFPGGAAYTAEPKPLPLNKMAPESKTQKRNEGFFIFSS